MLLAMKSPAFPPGWPDGGISGDDLEAVAVSAWLVSIAQQRGDGAARFRWVLAAARIPTGDVARLLGRERRLVARWIAGSKPIPDDLWRVLARLAALG